MVAENSDNLRPAGSLQELEERLSGLSHSQDAIEEVAAFSAAMKNTKARIEAWNATGVLVRRPITQGEAEGLGFTTDDDKFTMLQGDIVATEAAYFLGERVLGAKFAVINSSCDLVTGRNECASLFRVFEVRKDDQGKTEEQIKSQVATLLKFSRRDALYLPKLPSDAPEVIANAITFDGLCQIRIRDLLLASRIVSLSVLGWRVFASMNRAVFARANPREVEIRQAVQNSGTGTSPNTPPTPST